MGKKNNSILDSLWWVKKFRLGGLRKPTTNDEVGALKKEGISALVTVLDDEENHELYKKTKMPFLWLPVKRGTSPNMDQVREFLSFVREYHHQDQAVGVHCTGGRKRTGTLLAAFLIMHENHSPDEAVEKILRLNKEVKFNDLQLEFIKSLD